MTEPKQKDNGYITEQPQETAILAGVNLPLAWSGGLGGLADLDELGRLVETAGAKVVGRLEQTRPRPTPSTFFGKGKLEELAEMVEAMDATMVVFDNELSPAQGRNLETKLEVKVLDRTELILDIFAGHARTRQAKLQVELAQLEYLLPRLTRLWSHLERQAGGIGTRGPGETQLETDRRLLGRRISRIKQQLKDIESTRKVQTGRRERLFTATLVGYTNAGKSTLMNGLTGAGILARDQLFATLDATTRRVEIDERRRFLLTDTVGFIRRLPHHLVESFKATLQEVREADLLVHVVDASCEDPGQQIQAVDDVLESVAPGERNTLMVFNKMDLVPDEGVHNRFSRQYPEAIFLSAKNSAGIEILQGTLVATMMGAESIVTLTLPISRLHLLSPLHRTGSVLEQEFRGQECLATIRVTDEERNRICAEEGVRDVSPPQE